jgi:hypothetical protein
MIRWRRPFLAGVLLSILCGSRSADGAPAEPVPGYCDINVVFGPLVTGGHVAVIGFAVDETNGAPVREIQLTLDRVTRGESSLMGLRPDVLAHFARQDYLWSGWKATASLDGVTPGTHAVDIVAVTHQGKTIPCGTRKFEVSPGLELPRPRARAIALRILLRVLLFLLWITFVGFAPAAVMGGALRFASAPFLGLALFGIFAEIGGAFHVRPSTVALTLAVFSCVSIAATFRSRWQAGFHRHSGPMLSLVALTALFAVVGVIPFAAHGEGAVLGDIDDASRECVVADSVSRYGWRVPPDVAGHLATMRRAIEAHHVRPGGIYLLSSLADAFGVRSYEIHSAAMLAAGCLVVWGAGLLSLAVWGRRSTKGWLAPGLLVGNSALLAGLYGQHLGTLLSTALFLAFLAFVVKLARARSRRMTLAAASLAAAELVFYPEGMLLWVVAAVTMLAVARPRTRTRAAARLAMVFLLAATLNPIGVVRFARFGLEAARGLSTPLGRTVAGDTHYFAEPPAILGIEPYRDDAPAALHPMHRALVLFEMAAIVGAALIAWKRLSRQEKAIIVALLLPVGLALLGNLRLKFPYGYTKFLPAAAAVWSVAFVGLARRTMDRSAPNGAGRLRSALARSALLLAFLLAIPSAWYVVRRAIRSVPAYDPAYRALASLASTVGRRATILIDEPNIASREWMRYFLGENHVIDLTSSIAVDASPKYLLVDRRKGPATFAGRIAVSSSAFALARVESLPKPGS